MKDILERLAGLSLELPVCPAPLAAYVPAKRFGNVIYVSGQLPSRNGALPHGVVGAEISEVEARAAAAACFLNGLSAAATVLEEGETLELLQLQGFVQAAPGYENHAAVLNGASELALKLLGERGRHARAAVGVASLPKGVPVEISLVFAAVREA